jgi:alpha-tubulin suppressor-like RCC1 family protein
MNLSRIAALLALLLSNSAMAEPSWDKLFKAVGEVIENHAKNNQQQDAANNTDPSTQSTTADAGQSTENLNNSGPLALAPSSRSLERTLKLAPTDASKYTSASFFVTPTGKLVVWGSNKDVRLGLSEAKYTTSAGITEYEYQEFYDKPVVHPAFDDAVSVDTCENRTVVLTKKGEAWIFGKGASIIPATLAPTKIPGDGYIEARITCFHANHEWINLLKNDGTFWRLGGEKNTILMGDPSIQPVKVASGVKALSTVSSHFLLLMNNGEVAALGRDVYQGKNIKMSYAGKDAFPLIMKFPKLKDIVRIDANSTASHFTAYAANGSIYEMPLQTNGVNASNVSRLANGREIDFKTVPPRETVDEIYINNKRVVNALSYSLPMLLPTELTNAKNVCYFKGQTLYGLMLDNAGAVSVWAPRYNSQKNKAFKGLGVVPGKLIPQQIPSLSNIEEISCGYHHFAVKTKTGDISFYQIHEDSFLQPVLNLSLKPEPNKMNFLFNENAEFYK